MDYATVKADKIWWLESQIRFWIMRPTFDQWVTQDEVDKNITAIRERIAELEAEQ